ncbi:MAG: DUF4147 domain-containing protein [Phycisphaerales bacterium]
MSKDVVRDIIDVALRAADAGGAVRRAGMTRDLGEGPVALLAVGKASLAMAGAAFEELGRRVTHSFATTLPEHAGDPFWGSLPGPVFACDHPLPTARNIDASERLAGWVRSLPRGAVLAVLLSGGASAHLCSPLPGLGLEGLVEATRTLQRAGASIYELNCVRRHCETLKGGGLGALAAPRRVVTFVLSDVIGDPLHDIASGPTVADPTSRDDALAVARRYGLGAIERYLRAAPVRPVADLSHCRTRVVASNRMVAGAVVERLRAENVGVTELLDVEGCAAGAARRLAGCTGSVVMGGEWTVDTRDCDEPGVGGPSQELALWAAVHLRLPRWTLLALSTDGRDGPTDHAGACVDEGTAGRALGAGVDLGEALRRHDSTAALGRVGGLVTTGPTGTNLNHVAVLLVP